MSDSLKTIDEVRQHKHEIEYGQTTGDLMKKVVQMRCTECGYHSYTFFRTMAEVYRMHPELEQLIAAGAQS